MPLTNCAVFGSATSACVSAFFFPVAAYTSARTEMSPLLLDSGLVWPKRNGPHSGWPYALHPRLPHGYHYRREDQVLSRGDKILTALRPRLRIAQFDERRGGRTGDVGMPRFLQQLIDAIARAHGYRVNCDRSSVEKAMIPGVEGCRHILDPLLFLGAVRKGERDTPFGVSRRGRVGRLVDGLTSTPGRQGQEEQQCVNSLHDSVLLR